MPTPPVPTRAGPYLSAQNSMISVREQMAEAVAGAPTSRKMWGSGRRFKVMRVTFHAALIQGKWVRRLRNIHEHYRPAAERYHAHTSK
jgi:hypothetical protein